MPAVRRSSNPTGYQAIIEAERALALVQKGLDAAHTALESAHTATP